MNRTRGIIFFFLLVTTLPNAFSQVALMEEDLNSSFDRGMELYGKEKYTAAIRFFDNWAKQPGIVNTASADEAQYYAALSAIRLFNADGEYRMVRFISAHPGSPRLNDARLELAGYFYQNKSYKKACIWYDSVNRLMITKEKLPEYYFRNGYAQFMKGDRKRALLMFSEIKDIDTDYTPPALYYFSHIAYEDKKYETALEGFMRLKSDETFGPVVPFYIAQILYLKKDYDGLLTIAPDLLKSAGTQRSVELYRFIGDAYYNKGKYTEAISYLEKYSSASKVILREDRYQLAYCYYKTREYDKAIKIFLELTASSDIMSQNIWCLLGDSYLQKGDKPRALFAFGQASLMDYDKNLKEESLFNYAKLMYETSYSPFGEVITAFEEYIDLYPGSPRIEEVYNFLVATYTQLKNYKAAIASLDKIRNKDQRLEEAYQRVAFYRGLELINNMELQPAIDMFDKSLKYEKYSRPLRARAIYWRGEAWYRLGSYDNAIADYQQFMGIPGSLSLKEYKLVRYNLGYALFNEKDYSGAINHFKAFESSASDTGPELLADARNRIADCYYITTNYAQAINYYNKVIDYGKADADYALYQKGFALGLTNDNRGKTQVLTTLITRFPQSKYVPGAIFERGRAYVMLKDQARGESDFNNVISTYTNSPFVPRAIVQMGLLYFDSGENQKAVEQFKKVIQNYPSTSEARSAMTGLRNTYMEMNDVESYYAYVKTLNGYGDINLAEKDSLLYASGEKLYMTGNCDRASEIFKNYLSEFKNGSFRINALYYLADCANSVGRKDEAYNYYLEVTQTPGNDFLEPSLLAISAIAFGKEDYLKALGFYEQLEKVSDKPENIIAARRGQLRSAWGAGDASKTITAADKIVGAAGVPEELLREAYFMRAKAHYSLNQFDEALRDFTKISNEITSVQGAESKYRVAELLEKKGQTAEAEKVINEFIDKNTPHQYWMARVFLLYSDISIKKGDKVLARATLQGLKDNYPVDSDGILDEVKEKLDSLVEKQGNPADTSAANRNTATETRK
jgi:tetratricopeptide (TPR) repeat protein